MGFKNQGHLIMAILETDMTLSGFMLKRLEIRVNILADGCVYYLIK
jgi:hypothetical protein